MILKVTTEYCRSSHDLTHSNIFKFEIRIPYFRRVLIPSVTGTGILELEMQLFEDKVEISQGHDGTRSTYDQE